MKRTIHVLADRAIPVLELIARAHATITYEGLAALITRRGETLVIPQLMGKVLGEVLQQGLQPDSPPWVQYLPAFCVSKSTGKPSMGWYEYRSEQGLDEVSPAYARDLASAWIGEAWVPDKLNERVTQAHASIIASAS